MITNRDIEIAFVRARTRINEEIDKAQIDFIMPDIMEDVNAMAGMVKKRIPRVQNENNPIANEEI